jgi:outer membrane protein W
MKKITLLFSMLAIVFAHGQNDDTNATDNLTFAKGSQFINLNIFFVTSNADQEVGTESQNSKDLGVSINPSYSYAVSDNLFLGLGVGYTFADNDVTSTFLDDRNTTDSGYSIFPFVRYYKGIGKKLALFVQGEARYDYSKSEFNDTSTDTRSEFFIGVRPGLVFMFSKNFGFETSIGALGYTTVNTEDEGVNQETDIKSFSFSLDSTNLMFGLNYYF